MTTGLLLTAAGRAAIIADAGNTAELVLTHVAFGDANGVPYPPNDNQTALVRETYRSTIASVAVVAGALVIDAVIPADTPDASNRPSHGFSVAEAGLYGTSGGVPVLIGVARLGNGFKPSPSSGQASVATYRLKLACANPSSISVVIDPQAQVILGRHVRPFFMAIEGVANAPPANPVIGSTYAIGPTPTGAWAGFAGRLAQWVGVWTLAAVVAGHVVVDNSKPIIDGSRWLRYSVTEGWVSSSATEIAQGVTRLATSAEAIAATAGDIALSPRSAAALIASKSKIRLKDDLNIFVRPDGNDTDNTGLANTAAGAFKSITRAINYAVREIDPSGFVINISVADGTYNEAVLLIRAPACQINLVGNKTNPQNCIINAPAGVAACILVKSGSMMDVSGFTLNGQGGSGIMATRRAEIQYSFIRFGVGLGYQVFSQFNSMIEQTGQCWITANCGAHLVSSGQASITTNGQTITITGTPAFAIAFAWANGGQVAGTAMTFAGIATGRRYQVDFGGLVYTAGAGANYFPGNQDGLIFGGTYA